MWDQCSSFPGPQVRPLREPQRSGLTRALGPGAAVDAIPNVPAVPGAHNSGLFVSRDLRRQDRRRWTGVPMAWRPHSGIRRVRKASAIDAACRHCRLRTRSHSRTHRRRPQTAMANGVKSGRKRKRRNTSVLRPSGAAMPARPWPQSPKAMASRSRLSRAYEADLAGPGQLPSSTSRATGPKWIAAAIAIAANQASVISQPGNQPTMTAPKRSAGVERRRAYKRASRSSLWHDWIRRQNKTAFGDLEGEGCPRRRLPRKGVEERAVTPGAAAACAAEHARAEGFGELKAGTAAIQ